MHRDACMGRALDAQQGLTLVDEIAASIDRECAHGRAVRRLRRHHSDRPCKGGGDPAASIARMRRWTKAGQFDPAVYRRFVECIGFYPVGSLWKFAHLASFVPGSDMASAATPVATGSVSTV